MDCTQMDLFTAGTDGIAIFRIPSLIVTTNGTLLSFCEARKESCNDATPTDLVLKRSIDGGQSWLPMQTVLRGSGIEAIMNPCPVVDGKKILLFCMNAHKTGRGRHRYLLLSSSDDGVTWTEPVDITENISNCDDTFVQGPGIGIKMRNGRIIIPGGTKTFDIKKNPDGSRLVAGDHDQATCSGRAVYSDDGGRNWRMGKPVKSNTSNESQVVELADGSLMLNWREQNYRGPSAGCRGTAVSQDGGETWSDPVLVQALNENPCQGSILRYSLDDGKGGRNILLFSNIDVTSRSENHKERKNMTVRLSYDEGMTWTVKRSINPGLSAYSCLAALPDGMIALIYECGKKHPYERIRLARFSLDWLCAMT